MRQTLLMLVVFHALAGCGPSEPESSERLAALLPVDAATDSKREEDNVWSQAVSPRELVFPRDHGSHDDFRIEWWYYTGNLESADGRQFGYQLTFFRTGVDRRPENPSRWAVRNLYTAHFALSDIENRKHYSFETTRRAGVGGAGAEAERLVVWNGGWRAETTGDLHNLTAATEDVAIDFTLEPGRGPLLHGENGLSQKGEAVGNASYYYSFPRMPTVGILTLGGSTISVAGSSWMDHEFSTSFLENGQRGWDWFSLQLGDGSALMIYQMRRTNGSVDPYSSGTFVDPEGRTTHLSSADFQLTPGHTWTSDNTGAEYPLRWRIEAPKIDLALAVAPAFESQEMATEASTGIAYWEGSVRAQGRRGEDAVSGLGYLELTGYTETELGTMLGGRDRSDATSSEN